MMMNINGKPFVRPCCSIPPDGNESNEWIASIPKMYNRLTTPLLLAGASRLTRSRCGADPRIIATLRAEMPWMTDVIDRIADCVALRLWAGQPWLAIRPILLVGPPGAGKTHLARRLGELSGCGDGVLSLAGVRSSAELGGNPRGYRHQQPCFPAMTMIRTDTANPVLVIDEVDKAGSSEAGDPLATLLGMLEQSTARRFFDGCLATEIDLSHVNWILTANRADSLPAPLLSRVDVIEVHGPGPEYADRVLAALWRSVAHDLGLPPSAPPDLEAAAETSLLRMFRNTRSVRRLRRAIETLIAVSARHAPRTIN